MYISDTIMGEIKLEKRKDNETDFEFYDVYQVSKHPYKENDKYLGELHTSNEGKALEQDVYIFLTEHKALDN